MITTVNLLEQTTVWKSAEGMIIRLDEMGPDWRANLLRYLRRQPAIIRRCYDFIVLRSYSEYGIDMTPLTPEVHDEAAAWLERRPLVIELARLVALDQRGPVVDGEVVVSAAALDRRTRAIAATNRGRELSA